MNRAFTQFEESIKRALDSSVLYDFCTTTISAPFAFDDILRFQLVYGVSAFDTLIHRLVRIGMVETFNGRRIATDKYKAENISLSTFVNLMTATVPPPEHYFEREIIRRHKYQSFQDPSKIADALSLIWEESQKWAKISTALGLSESVVKTTLKAICSRRNCIVHEADIDPITDAKLPITKSDSESAVNFLKQCGEAIYNLVK